MLAKLQDVIRPAQRRGYAVGAFNVSDLEMIQAVIAAAVKMKSPAIINTSEKAITYAGIEEISTLVKIMAKKAPVPIVLNLDHGHAVPLATSCLRHGYTGIMFDGSRFPDAMNITRTRAVVRHARRYGVGVEGELGVVKFVEDATNPRTGSHSTKTDPAQAAEFIRRTDVAAFAVAIGNAHGLPQPDEKLDFPLLRSIRQRVSVPLVLHGASGTKPADIRQAIRLGIAKINIDTDLRLAFTAALRSFLRTTPKAFDPRAELSPARDAIMTTVMAKMELFGSAGKGRL